MTTSFGFVIRDGLKTDVEACLALDHSYQTEHVWQMSIRQDQNQRQITFRIERLPRAMEVVYPADTKRLHLVLPVNQCFLVAVGREQQEVVGYLTMRQDSALQNAQIHDIVVSRDYRRLGIGTRLLRIGRQWARERDLNQLTIETQTKNYPAITFGQKSGFVFCGFNDHYYTNQDIAVFFSQSLR